MTWIIVLAAGKGSRFGEVKQLASIVTKQNNPAETEIPQSKGIDLNKAKKQSLVNYQLNKLTKLNLPILLVLGYQHQSIIEQIPTVLKEKITVLINHNWQAGIASSIAHAVTYLTEQDKQNQTFDGKRVLFFLLDQVLVTTDDLTQLINQQAKQPDQICCAFFNQLLGSPAIFPSRYFKQLQQLTGDQGALKLIKTAGQYQYISMQNAAFDIDTKAQLKALTQANLIQG